MKRNASFVIKVSLIIVSAVCIIGYSLYESRNLIEGPELSLMSPENGASASSPLTEITGLAKNISYITLNGKQIFVDDKGMFKEKLLLSLGYNIITVSVKDKFGREESKSLTIIL